MISAAEALRLPSACLSEEEQSAVSKVLVEIDTHVRAHMERRGAYDFKTAERRPNVIAEVNQRLKAAGWNANWKPWVGTEILSGSRGQSHIGWHLELAPTDEAYQAASAEQGGGN